MADYLVTDTELTSIADAIRTKGGTSATLTFPSGFNTAIAAIPTGITPSGTISITANGTVDVTNYASADVNISGGGTLKTGVIRPDAELVQSWTSDQYLVADLGIAIPDYSNSSKTLKATATITTYSGSPTEYTYLIIQKILSIPEYSTTTKFKGRQEYTFCTALYEWIYNPTGEIMSIDQTGSYGQYSQMLAVGQCSRHIYWTSATAISPYTSNIYGFSQGIGAPTITANKTITIKSPSITCRGSTTYFTSEAWGYLTDVRIQWVNELWRVPITQGTITGWAETSLEKHIINCVHNNGGTLT